MRGLSRIRLLAGTGALALLIAAWIFLGPQQLGGSATYAIVAGSSMEPQIHGGDLVVSRSRAHYAIGDAVVYHNADLNRNVLHRIVGRDGSRFLFKGDGNDFVDPTRPKQSDLIGRPVDHRAGSRPRRGMAARAVARGRDRGSRLPARVRPRRWRTATSVDHARR